MIANGLDDDVIKESTGLSSDEIATLKREI